METVEIIKRYMLILRTMMDSGKLNSDEYNALEFAHELAEYEFFAEIQRTQEEVNHLKQTGMLH